MTYSYDPYVSEIYSYDLYVSDEFVGSFATRSEAERYTDADREDVEVIAVPHIPDPFGLTAAMKRIDEWSLGDDNPNITEETKMVKFAMYTLDERVQAGRIAARACAEWGIEGMETALDIAAVHVTNPLRLKELAEADDFNFTHDILGIRENLNRKTGRLENFFVPRFSQPERKV